jgi:hypothetical protein
MFNNIKTANNHINTSTSNSNVRKFNIGMI